VVRLIGNVHRFELATPCCCFPKGLPFVDSRFKICDRRYASFCSYYDDAMHACESRNGAGGKKGTCYFRLSSSDTTTEVFSTAILFVESSIIFLVSFLARVCDCYFCAFSFRVLGWSSLFESTYPKLDGFDCGWPWLSKFGRHTSFSTAACFWSVVFAFWPHVVDCGEWLIHESVLKKAPKLSVGSWITVPFAGEAFDTTRAVTWEVGVVVGVVGLSSSFVC